MSDMTRVLLALTVIVPVAPFQPLNCGKVEVLHGPRGIISTPNFPDRFPTPIQCRWVIDSQGSQTYIFFTQQFVTTGLTITECMLYDNSICYSPKVIFKLPSEQKPLDYKLVHPNGSFLQIDFELDVLQGNHVRELFHLMYVYGFNITYEIGDNVTVENKSCSVLECSLNGHCYANNDFSKYQCSCFDNFFGDSCQYSTGCQPGDNYCDNGGYCGQLGETNKYCQCPKNYTGSKCDTLIPQLTEEYNRSLHNTVECRHQDVLVSSDLPCDCKDSYFFSYSSDRARYTVTVRLSDSNRITSSEDRIEQKINNLKWNQHDFSHPRVLNITRIDKNIRNITVSFTAPRTSKSEIIRMSESFSQIMKEAFPDSSAVHLRPEIYLEKIAVNSNDNTVVEGDQFILSCTARGTLNTTFSWFKDGTRINETMAIRGIWTSISYYDSDKYIGMLSIEKAELFDSGLFTCQIKDRGLQQCKSLYVTITPTPKIKLYPLSITAEKGQNITILCSSKQQQYDSKFGYTWLRNDQLLKMDIPNTYWEDLYIGGSMLFINNTQVSGIFKCTTGQSSASVRVDVLDRRTSPFCEAEGVWPLTMPGTQVLLECPPGYADGIYTRLCVMNAPGAQWAQPNYAACVSNRFNDIIKQFRVLTLGYQNNSVTATETLKSLHSYLTTSNTKLLPGEGEPIVKFLKLVYDFLERSSSSKDFEQSTPHFFSIIDILLTESTSILDKTAIYSLSYLIEKWTSNLYNMTDVFKKDNKMNKSSSQFKSFELSIPLNYRSELKLLSNITIMMYKKAGPGMVEFGVMTYKNLSSMLLAKDVSNQRYNKEVWYKLTSPIVHVLTNENTLPRKKRTLNTTWFEAMVEFELPFGTGLPVRWDICCGLVAGFGRSWNLDMCRSSPTPHAIKCTCKSAGLFAVFAAPMPNMDDEQSKKHMFLIISCMICFLLSMCSLSVLLPRWCRIRSCLTYVKIQICICIAVAMLLFVYASYDPSIDFYPYILAGLQISLLVSLSSHISILIIMYLDIISLKKIPNIKVSAISVMSVTPILLVVVAPLSRKITNERITCWWLCKGTLLYYIHSIVGLVFLMLFIYLYYSVMKKLWFLWHSTKVQRTVILERTSFLLYTLLTFVMTVFMVISSIFYVHTETLTSQYVFGFSCTLLGLLTCVVYIPRNHLSFICLLMFPEIKRTNQKYSPELQIIPITSAMERDNMGCDFVVPELSSQSDIISENIYLRTYKATEDGNTAAPMSIEKSSQQQNTITENIQEDAEQKPEAFSPTQLAHYVSQSPTSQAKNIDCHSLSKMHPEMLKTRVCVELGVVQNLQQSGENSTVVICSVDVEPCPGHIVELNEVKFTTNSINSETGLKEVNDVKFAANPINYESGTIGLETVNLQTNSDDPDSGIKLKEVNCVNQIDSRPPQQEVDGLKIESNEIKLNNSDKVLDLISQDLDFLLNRSPTARQPSLKSVSVSPKKNDLTSKTKL